MDERTSRIIADLELLLRSYPKLEGKDQRQTVRMAYLYRLSQLEAMNSVDVLRQYRHRYSTISEEPTI